tara:strand:- start:126 stop:1538 length:1413 start_codon:yes stop_codon:yes gene_type:complete
MDDQKNKLGSDPNIAPINGAPFYSKFILTGPDGGEINFSKSSIRSLDLEENFFQPFVVASMTVSNPFDYIENAVSIRGDGKERMKVTLYNASYTEEERAAQNLPSIKDIQVDYTFVVNNEDNDVSKTDRSNNFKTFQLVDENYFKLNEKIPYAKRYDGYVGDIIAQVLEEVLGSDIVDRSRWEPGMHKIDKFPEFIIPPISFRYSDLLKYLLRIYYFIDGDLPVQGMLNFDRITKQFTLTPMSYLFADNEKLAQEAFGLGELIDNKNLGDNENNPISKAPVNEYQNQIRSTNLTTPMLVYSNEFFTNYSISTTDQRTGIEYKELIAIKDIKDSWKKIFVDSFKCVGGKPEAFLPLNEEKTDITKPFILPFNSTVVRNLAIAQMVSNMTFFNLQLNLDNPGDTNRRPGKFIDVFKPDKIEKPVDKKILGRWFLTKVRHRFFKDSYQNVLQGVKAYVGPASKITDNPKPAHK